MTDSNTAIAVRTKSLLRAYMRHLRCKPSTLEGHALRRAASLTARAEIAAADSAVPVDELVRLDNAAARARADLAKVIAARHREQPKTRGKKVSHAYRFPGLPPEDVPAGTESAP